MPAKKQKLHKPERAHKQNGTSAGEEIPFRIGPVVTEIPSAVMARSRYNRLFSRVVALKPGEMLTVACRDEAAAQKLMTRIYQASNHSILGRRPTGSRYIYLYVGKGRPSSK